MKKEDQLLYKWFKYYYSLGDDNILSLIDLAKELNSTKAKVNTMLKIFAENLYILSSKEKVWKANMIKVAYKTDFTMTKNDQCYYFDSNIWINYVDIEYAKVVMDQFNITEDDLLDFETMMFVLFTVHGTNKTSTKVIYKLIDGKLWLLKEGYCRATEDYIYKTGYTQGNDKLVYGENL